MPFSSVHVLFRMMGTFGPNATANTEQWSASMRINTGLTGTGEAQKTAFLTTVAGVVNTFHTSTGVAAGTACWLTQLTAAYIDTDGKYLGGGAQNTTVYAYGTPSAGAIGQATSWDVARVYSLRTAQPRGRGHVGRFYYPCQDVIATDGRWTSAMATAAAAAAKTLIEQVNAAAKTQWTASFGVSVMSEVGAVSYPVNRVEVGRAPDTMRSRTRALVEGPSSASIAGTLSTEEVAAGRVYSPL